MMRKWNLLVMACMMFAAASTSRAAIVTWDNAATISGGSDVNTEGTQVFGRNIGLIHGDPTAVVNGVDFGFSNPNWTVTFSETFDANSFGGATDSATFGGPDAANYKAILDFARYGGTFASFTLGNLTLGQQYLLQFWVADYRPFPNDRNQILAAEFPNTNVNEPTLAYLDSDGPIHGQYAIGRWTADATSITFTLNGNESVQYSALQLRAVPEPSSLALLVLGSIGLCLMRRNRKR